MPATLLPHSDLLTIYEAAIQAGLGQQRDALLSGIDPRLVASMPVAPTRSAQLMSDLNTLTQIEELTDGSVPLITWLQNAIQLAGPRREGDVFRSVLAMISGGAMTSASPVEDERSTPAPDAAWSGVRCFLAYDPADARFAQELQKHLSPLRRAMQLSVWDINRISAGLNVNDEIRAHLNTADLALLLISADFLASESLYAEVVQPALARRAQGLKVVPILVRPCDFWGSPLGHLQPLPSSGEPITSLRSTDSAYADIARSISEIIKLRTRTHGSGARAAQTKSIEPQEIDGQSRFAMRKVDGSGAAGKSQHFLDICPFPLWHESAESLFQMLCDAYPDARGAQMVAQRAGLNLRDWNRVGSPREFWHSLLETAQRQDKLRALIDAVLKDGTRAAYHEPIKKLIAPPG